jgi:hypothetical protein
LQNEKFNANDFFFNKDRIDRPKARRNEGGFTIGGPIIKDRFFFFGGYQRTHANTGFVPTASSITVLPAALGLISGERTKDNLFNAFRALNPGITASIPNANAIADVAVRLLNVRNPATGDFLIPGPRPGTTLGVDAGVTGNVGGNPYIRQRNVFPAEFQQDQITAKLDGRLTNKNTLNGTIFWANFPGFDPFPDPGSLASPVTVKRSDRNRTSITPSCSCRRRAGRRSPPSTRSAARSTTSSTRSRTAASPRPSSPGGRLRSPRAGPGSRTIR